MDLDEETIQGLGVSLTAPQSLDNYSSGQRHGVLIPRDSRVIHTSSLQLWGSASCVTHIVRICTPSLVHSAVLFMRVHKRPDILLLLRGVRHMVTAHETVTLSPGSTGKSISRSWCNEDTASYRSDVKWPDSPVMNYKRCVLKVSIKYESHESVENLILRP